MDTSGWSASLELGLALLEEGAVADLEVARIHAKIVLADMRIAVIGSANITGAGLGQNLEVGVAVGGPDAEWLAQLFARLYATQLIVRAD